jgi:hypothetical protein
MTSEKKYYAVVKVRKAELIRPTESQLMSYYMDYGYNNVDEVVDDYGSLEEVLREWYNNTNYLNEFTEHQQQSNIFGIDWDSEWEQVDIIEKENWESIYNSTYVS